MFELKHSALNTSLVVSGNLHFQMTDLQPCDYDVNIHFWSDQGGIARKYTVYGKLNSEPWITFIQNVYTVPYQ